MTYKLAAPLALTIGLLAGCEPLTEENAPEKLAETVCRKERACDTERWDDAWGREFDECVDENEDAFEAAINVGDIIGLEIDLEEVQRCRADIAAASCEDYIEGDIGVNCDDTLSF